MIEVVHKEIRKYVLIEYEKYSKDFNLKNVLLDSVNTHNHNVHSTTGFKPIDIINNFFILFNTFNIYFPAII